MSCTRILRCLSEEWARGRKQAYRPYYRHKRTTVPPVRDFDSSKRNPTGVPWIDKHVSLHYLKKYGERHSCIKRKVPTNKRSLAAIYEFCANFAEQQFSTMRREEVCIPESSPLALHCNNGNEIYQSLSRLTARESPPGHIAFQGKCFLEYELVKYTSQLFPRLRSGHIHELLAHFCNLEPITFLARKIAMVKEFDLETDVALWRELNVLHIQKDHYLKQIRIESDRIAIGNMSENLAHNKRVLRFINSQLRRRLPVTKEDLIPVMEWFRSHFHAWLAYFSHTRGKDAARKLLRELAFGPFAIDKNSISVDALEARKMLINKVLNSSGGWRSVIQPIDAVFERRKSHSPSIPETILRCINPTNALKEAQIILKHSKDVPVFLKNGKISCRERYTTYLRKNETEDFSHTVSNKGDQLTRMDFYCGSKLLGYGEGHDIQQGIQEACIHMVGNFYAHSSK